MAAFPRHSIVWKLEEQSLWRRISLSLPWYGIGIGVVVRLYRWGVLSIAVPLDWGMTLATIGIGVVMLCGFTVGHLANFTLRHWKWRAPALGGFIALGESVTSLALTLVHQERLGRAVATLADWPGTAVNVLLTRVVVVSLFALVLAVVVIAIRKSTEGSSSEERETKGDEDRVVR